MSTATAEILTQPAPATSGSSRAPAEIVDLQGTALTKIPQEIMEDARVGAERLMRMPPNELRELIARRVNMLETELSEREARRAAIEEAMVAQRVLDSRRQRARRIRRKVNIGSSVAAAMFTGLVLVGMF